MKKLILIILLLLNFSFANAGDIIQPVMIIPGWLQADSIYVRAVLVDTFKTDHTTFKDSSITIESSDKTFITTDSVSIGGNFVVDKSGNVSIGTSSANYKLNIAGSSSLLHLDGLNHARMYIDAADAGRNATITFQTNGVDKISIGKTDEDLYGDGEDFFIGKRSDSVDPWLVIDDDNGYVAVNTTIPDHLLDVAGKGNLALTGVDVGTDSTVIDSNSITIGGITADSMLTVKEGGHFGRDVLIDGDLTVTGTINGSGDYSEMGNVHGSDATEVLAVADQWYAMYHANINSGLLEGWTYTDGHAGAISATSTGAGATVTMTSAGHTLAAGDWVTINGTTTYNGIEEIVSISGNDFVITETNSEADEGGGDAAFQEGSYLECVITGKYRGIWTCSFKQSAANAQTTIMSPFVNGTQLDKDTSEEYLANANDVATPAGNGIINFTAGQRIWFGVQSTVAQTITSKVRNVSIE